MAVEQTAGNSIDLYSFIELLYKMTTNPVPIMKALTTFGCGFVGSWGSRGLVLSETQI